MSRETSRTLDMSIEANGESTFKVNFEIGLCRFSSSINGLGLGLHSQDCMGKGTELTIRLSGLQRQKHRSVDLKATLVVRTNPAVSHFKTLCFSSSDVFCSKSVSAALGYPIPNVPVPVSVSVSRSLIVVIVIVINHQALPMIIHGLFTITITVVREW